MLRPPISEGRAIRAPTARRRARGDRGTVLLLMPAAVFAVMVLGAIAVDVGLVSLRAQQLRFVADSAAGDALGALDVDELRSRGRVRIDRARATELIRSGIARGPLPDAEITAVSIDSDRSGRIEIAVRLRFEAELVIAPALPGRSGPVTVTATGRALVVGGP